MMHVTKGPVKIFEYDGVNFWQRSPDHSLVLVDIDDMQTLVDEARQHEENLTLAYGIWRGSEDEPKELPLVKAGPQDPPEEEIERPKFNASKYYAVERSTGKKP